MPLIQFSTTTQGKELIFPWKNGKIYWLLASIGLFSWIVISKTTKEGWEYGMYVWLILIFVLVYLALAHYFNESRLLITPKYLQISHGPVPWWRSMRKISRDEIDQFYVEVIRSRRRRDYRLRLQLHTGKTISLFPGVMLDEYDLKSLERELERELGIRNRSMWEEDDDAGRAMESGCTYDDVQDFFLAEKDDILHWQGRYYQVYNHREYHWDKGAESYSVHAKTSTGQVLHFYFQEMDPASDQLAVYEEQEIKIRESPALQQWRPYKDIPLVYKHTTYPEQQTQTGEVHRAEGRRPHAKQWQYWSAAGTSYIRIVIVNGKKHIYWWDGSDN